MYSSQPSRPRTTRNSQRAGTNLPRLPETRSSLSTISASALSLMAHITNPASLPESMALSSISTVLPRGTALTGPAGPEELTFVRHAADCSESPTGPNSGEDLGEDTPIQWPVWDTNNDNNNDGDNNA